VIFAGAIGRANRAAFVVGSICVVVLGVLTFRQAGVWKDNTTLGNHTLAVNPRSFVAYTMLGAERIPVDPQAAIEDFKLALKIEPTYTKVLTTIAPLLEASGRIGELRALTESYVAAEEKRPPQARDDLRGAKQFLKDHGPR
jgi:hypothetical protein